VRIQSRQPAFASATARQASFSICAGRIQIRKIVTRSVGGKAESQWTFWRTGRNQTLGEQFSEDLLSGAGRRADYSRRFATGNFAA